MVGPEPFPVGLISYAYPLEEGLLNLSLHDDVVFSKTVVG